MALNGVRNAPIETGTCCAVVSAKLGDDGLLTLLNDKEAGSKPNKHRYSRDYDKKASDLLEIGVKATSAARRRIAAATVLTQEFVELSIEFTPQFI
jgi:hypothetical protein